MWLCGVLWVVVSLLYVGVVRCVIRLKYIPVAAGTPSRGDKITQSSAPEDGHMVARNMLS